MVIDNKLLKALSNFFFSFFKGFIMFIWKVDLPMEKEGDRERSLQFAGSTEMANMTELGQAATSSFSWITHMGTVPILQ